MYVYVCVFLYPHIHVIKQINLMYVKIYKFLRLRDKYFIHLLNSSLKEENL